MSGAGHSSAAALRIVHYHRRGSLSVGYPQDEEEAPDQIVIHCICQSFWPHHPSGKFDINLIIAYLDPSPFGASLIVLSSNFSSVVFQIAGYSSQPSFPSNMPSFWIIEAMDTPHRRLSNVIVAIIIAEIQLAELVTRPVLRALEHQLTLKGAIPQAISHFLPMHVMSSRCFVS